MQGVQFYKFPSLERSLAAATNMYTSHSDSDAALAAFWSPTNITTPKLESESNRISNVHRIKSWFRQAVDDGFAQFVEENGMDEREAREVKCQ